jgi:transposase-like protein
MTICPDCKSNRCVSKGWRIEGIIQRFFCKSCNKAFSVNYTERIDNTEKSLMVSSVKEPNKRIQKLVTINASPDTKERLICMKVYYRETLDDVIKRLLDNYNEVKL